MHARQPGRARYPCPACGTRTRGSDYAVRTRDGRILVRICDTPQCTSSRHAVRAVIQAQRNPTP